MTFQQLLHLGARLTETGLSLYFLWVFAEAAVDGVTSALTRRRHRRLRQKLQARRPDADTPALPPTGH